MAGKILTKSSQFAIFPTPMYGKSQYNKLYQLYIALVYWFILYIVILKGGRHGNFLFHSLYQLNGKIVNYTFFKFFILTIKQVIESVSGYWNT